MSKIIEELTKDAVARALRDLYIEQRAEGKAEVKAEIALKMIKKGMSLDLISEVTGITIEVLESMKKE